MPTLMDTNLDFFPFTSNRFLCEVTTSMSPKQRYYMPKVRQTNTTGDGKIFKQDGYFLMHFYIGDTCTETLSPVTRQTSNKQQRVMQTAPCCLLHMWRCPCCVFGQIYLLADHLCKCMSVCHKIPLKGWYVFKSKNGQSNLGLSVAMIKI